MHNVDLLRLYLRSKQSAAMELMDKQFKLEIQLKQLQTEMEELEKQIEDYETPQ
jgi:peptidoglycan hydrolase CwlO-like protein